MEKKILIWKKEPKTSSNPEFYSGGALPRRRMSRAHCSPRKSCFGFSGSKVSIPRPRTSCATFWLIRGATNFEAVRQSCLPFLRYPSQNLRIRLLRISSPQSGDFELITATQATQTRVKTGEALRAYRTDLASRPLLVFLKELLANHTYIGDVDLVNEAID